jgi:hypothetical protein
MQVRNMTSAAGNKVANQFIIDNGEGEIFQSYETTIAIRLDGRGILLDNNALNYSQTTSKYLYQFLGLNRKEIEQWIKEGKIKEVDLNAI